MYARYVPWMIYAKGRDIHEFYFEVPDKPNVLRDAFGVFTDHNMHILSVSAYAIPGENIVQVFVFADAKDADVSLEEFREILKEEMGYDVRVTESLVKGFMMGELAFPLYVFPGVRSMIMLEPDFQEMLKGFYRKLGDIAATFLYHLTYSGGKLMSEYLSRKLGLKGRELLVETLKFYQASGWGRVELVEYNPYRLNIVLRLYESIECKAFGRSDKPASQFIRGHLSGLLSGLLKINVRAVETKCIAMGDPYCEFRLERV